MEKIKKSAVPVWPLVLIAGSAFVAIWSGWVGLGQMTGFGMVELLPGIVEDWEINSAITLPIGMEVYAAFALRVYLAPPPGLSKMAKRYAAISAFAALGLGAAGQVTYHLMQAEGLTVAPWQITTFVSCLPVAVLAAAAALLHLVRSARTTVTVEVPAAAPAASPVPLLQTPADLEAEREHARRLVAEEEREEHLRAQERDDVARDQDQDGDLLRVLLDAVGQDVHTVAGQAGPVSPVPPLHFVAPHSERQGVEQVPAVLEIEAGVDSAEQEIRAELAGCETKRDQLLLAWRHLGVEGLPQTGDVMPAVEWLAERGVRVDKSGAYDLRRRLAAKQHLPATRVLTAVGGGR